MTDWLYQIRIVVTSALSTDLRSMGTSTTAQEVAEIAKKYDMRAVCTYDAFKAYCEEAEGGIAAFADDVFELVTHGYVPWSMSSKVP